MPTPRQNPRYHAVQLLKHDDSFATTLLGALISLDMELGEMLEWSPTVLRYEIERGIGEPFKQHLFDRLMAGITVLRNPTRFYQDPAGFVHLANILARTPAEFGEFDPADPVECAWAVYEAGQLDPPEPGEEAISRFSPDVLSYIGLTLQHYGLIVQPRVLEFVPLPRDLNPALDFAESPVLVSAVTQVQDIRVQEVNAEVNEMVRELATQIEPLVADSAGSDSSRREESQTAARLFPSR